MGLVQVLFYLDLQNEWRKLSLGAVLLQKMSSIVNEVIRWPLCSPNTYVCVFKQAGEGGRWSLESTQLLCRRRGSFCPTALSCCTEQNLSSSASRSLKVILRTEPSCPWGGGEAARPAPAFVSLTKLKPTTQNLTHCHLCLSLLRFLKPCIYSPQPHKWVFSKCCNLTSLLQLQFCYHGIYFNGY